MGLNAIGYYASYTARAVKLYMYMQNLKSFVPILSSRQLVMDHKNLQTG